MVRSFYGSQPLSWGLLWVPRRSRQSILCKRISTSLYKWPVGIHWTLATGWTFQMLEQPLVPRRPYPLLTSQSSPWQYFTLRTHIPFPLFLIIKAWVEERVEYGENVKYGGIRWLIITDLYKKMCCCFVLTNSRFLHNCPANISCGFGFLLWFLLCWPQIFYLIGLLAYNSSLQVGLNLITFQDEMSKWVRLGGSMGHLQALSKPQYILTLCLVNKNLWIICNLRHFSRSGVIPYFGYIFLFWILAILSILGECLHVCLARFTG